MESGIHAHIVFFNHIYDVFQNYLIHEALVAQKSDDDDNNINNNTDKDSDE